MGPPKKNNAAQSDKPANPGKTSQGVGKTARQTRSTNAQALEHLEDAYNKADDVKKREIDQQYTTSKRQVPEGMEVDDDGTSAPPEEEKKDAAPNEAPQERGSGQPNEASGNPRSKTNAAEPQFKAEEDDGLFLTEHHTGKQAHTGDNSSDDLEELGDIGRITSATSIVDSKLDISIKGPFGKWYAIYRDGPRQAPYYHMGRMADGQFSESGKNVFRLGESGSEPRIRRVIGFVGYKTYHDYLGLLKALAQRHWPAENGSTRKKPPMMFVCVQWEDRTTTWEWRGKLKKHSQFGGQAKIVAPRTIEYENVVLVEDGERIHSADFAFVETAAQLAKRHQQWILGQRKSESRSLSPGLVLDTVEVDGKNFQDG